MKKLIIALSIMLGVITCNYAQNYYAAIGTGFAPSTTLGKVDCSNRIEVGYLYKNFNCGLGLQSNYGFKDYYITVFPTAVLFSTEWASIFGYLGPGVSIKSFKTPYVEAGIGMNLFTHKHWFVPICMSYTYLDQSTKIISCNIGFYYIFGKVQ